MGQVYRLAAVEAALVDSDSVQALRQSLGDEKCEQLLQESLFQIADRLSLVEIALKSRDLPEIYRLCLNLVGTAEQVGMVGVAYVARELMNCCMAGNMTAIQAVAARLIRVGEDSLFSTYGTDGRV
jgi:hypothetical protein